METQKSINLSQETHPQFQEMSNHQLDQRLISAELDGIKLITIHHVTLKRHIREFYTLLCQTQQVLNRLRHFWAAQSLTNEQLDAAAMLNRSFSIARHRNPILCRFKLWKDFFKDQFNHSSPSANPPQHETLNLCNIWFILKDLFSLCLIAQLDLIQNNEADIYRSMILNIEEDVSQISYSNIKATLYFDIKATLYFDIKATLYPDSKHKTEMSTHLLMSNYLKIHANVNKLTEMFILFWRQLELSTFARHRNPILPRFKFWKDIFKDQISHFYLSVNLLQHVVLNLCNIWFIQAFLSFIIPNSHNRDDKQKTYLNYE